LDLSIIVPAYNEQESLGSILPVLIDAVNARDWCLIIVNDGSTDQTREILTNLPQAGNIQVIHHKVNRGYGGALKTGIMAAATEYAVTLDADGQHDLVSIDALIAAQQRSDADLVIGARINADHHSAVRSVGKKFIRWISRILIPNQISDLNSGMKLYKTDLAQKYLALCPNTMAFSDVITLSFLSNRHLVVETPIEVQPRKTGKSTININTALDTVMEIINIVMLFNPLRIFLPLASLLLFAGLAWGIPIVIMGRGVSVGALLALVSGGLCLLLGLIAEQLSKIRRALNHHNGSDF
jgi:glycosyltransferase involved in cell wall biosynthesis